MSSVFRHNTNPELAQKLKQFAQQNRYFDRNLYKENWKKSIAFICNNIDKILNLFKIQTTKTIPLALPHPEALTQRTIF